MSRRLNRTRLTAVVLLAAFLGTLGTVSFVRRLDATEPTRLTRDEHDMTSWLGESGTRSLS